jgi:hypothetical protein
MHSGRLAYNEAIIETENQQILLTVVRNRYQETSNLLAVSSVTANVSVTTSTGIELGFGDDDNFAGNLVPFSGGVIYEENPTISYVPVGGSQYAQQLMSPVPVATVAQLTSTRINPALFYTALVARVNGIHNPDFLTPAHTSSPPALGTGFRTERRFRDRHRPVCTRLWSSGERAAEPPWAPRPTEPIFADRFAGEPGGIGSQHRRDRNHHTLDFEFARDSVSRHRGP